MSRTSLLFTVVLLVANGAPLFAEGLGTPKLSAPVSLSRFFDPERLLTTGGVKYAASEEITLEPELGLGYRTLERDLPGVGEQAIHKVHAQAGWRVSLAEALYLSAAAKLPVYSYQKAGNYYGQSLGSRQEYDLVRSLRSAPSWTGEVGLHLAAGADLTLYFDQGVVPGGVTGLVQQEDRVGTRIIWRFK
jgi:hypothetical protein